jgi:ABC-type sugar transport system ATPase subunit
MANIRLEGVQKTYPNGHRALRGLDLAVNDGELMVLVGPSGSGKSSALRIVAGLEAPTAGRVFIGDRDVTDWAPRERDVAMVFQSYALYPHKTVRDNLGFGLRMRSVAKAEIARRTREIAARLGLEPLLDRKPAQLSGGQRQRVALGRALIREPQLFLLDEPLSNLDAKLRAELRAEIGRLHAAFGVTTVYVTHDQEEAMTLGDRIAVLGPGGHLEQLAPPRELYARPANAFVAEFIGMPRINWFEGELSGHEFRSADVRVQLPFAAEGRREVKLGIRPHDLALCDDAHARLRGRVELVEVLGASQLVYARTEHGSEFRIVAASDASVARGDQVGATFAVEHLHLFDAKEGTRIEPAGQS